MDEMSRVFIDHHFQRRRDYISNLQNSYHRNQTEICKHLFALAAVGFGYNLTLMGDISSENWSFLLWLATAVGLGVTVTCCFLTFQVTSTVQNILIELTAQEFQNSEREEGKFEERLETKITWLNWLKLAAFIAFGFSMLVIVIQTALVNQH